MIEIQKKSFYCFLRCNYEILRSFEAEPPKFNEQWMFWLKAYSSMSLFLSVSLSQFSEHLFKELLVWDAKQKLTKPNKNSFGFQCELNFSVHSEKSFKTSQCLMNFSFSAF